MIYLENKRYVSLGRCAAIFYGSLFRQVSLNCTSGVVFVTVRTVAGWEHLVCPDVFRYATNFCSIKASEVYGSMYVGFVISS